MGTAGAVVVAGGPTSAWALRRAAARLRTDLRASGRGGEALPGAVPLLVGMLRSSRGRTRRAALGMLAELAEHPAAYWQPIDELGGPAVLAPVVPEAVRLAGDADRQVRSSVLPVLKWLGAGDAAVLAALRTRAEREPDPEVLAGQLTVLVALIPVAGVVPGGEASGGEASGGAGADGEDEENGKDGKDGWYAWFARWLGHPRPMVRLAALAGRLKLRPGTDAAGLGALASAALADTEDLGWPAVGLFHGMNAEALAGRPDESRVLADALLRTGASGRQSAGQRAAWALDQAARAVADRRTDTTDLYALAARHLDHPGWQVRERAARLLTDAGSDAAPYADLLAHRLLVLLPTYQGRAEAVALDHLGDPRVLTYLRHRISGSDYDAVLGRLAGSHPGEAATLLPRISAALKQEGGARAGALEALAAWGPPAAPVVPVLVGLLRSGEARRAAAALGAIGPAAERAAPRLRELVHAAGSPGGGAQTLHGPRTRPWHGTQTAAWALWRVTGDHRTALEVLGAAVEAGPGHPHLPYLADLGPSAVRHADAVRALLDSPGEWTRVEAAHAWWRLTGEPGPAVDVLVGELTGERAAARRARAERAAARVAGETGMAPVAWEQGDELSAVLRHLTAIGRPAGAAVPVLEAYLGVTGGCWAASS